MVALTQRGVRAAAFLAGFVLGQADACPAALQAAEPSWFWQEPGRRDPEAGKPVSKSVLTFGAEIWSSTVRGDLESNRSGITDTKFRLAGDTGIEDQVLPRFFVDYSPDSSYSIRLDLRWLDASGSNTLGQPVVFDGVSFPQGGEVSCDFLATWIGVEWRVHLGSETAEGFHGDSVVAVRWLDAQFEMSGAPGKGRQTYSIETLGYGFDMKHVFQPGVYVGGDIGVWWGFDDSFIGGEFALKAGYQSTQVDVELGFRWWSIAGAINDEPDLDLRMRGPFIGATVQF